VNIEELLLVEEGGETHCSACSTFGPGHLRVSTLEEEDGVYLCGSCATGLLTGGTTWRAIAERVLSEALFSSLLVAVVQGEGEVAPTEVADITGVGLSTVSYHFKRLEKLGIVELVNEEAREINSTKHYWRVKPALRLAEAVV
jgi:DNA-binding transcriptional ArsR family regulator